jgi:hypothetical protein
MADRAVWVRLVILLVLLGYLPIIVASTLIPLPLYLEGPLVLVGWSFLPILFIWARLRRVTRTSAHPPAMDMLRPLALTITFGTIATVALFLAIAWEVPSRCHVTINCVKGYEWHMQNGKYYHVIDGVSAEISRAAYTQETGIDLRSAAAFGLYAMCLAWLGAVVLRTSPIRPPT